MPHKNYDIAHLQTMLITEHRIKRAYEQAIDDFMRIYDWMEKPENEDDTLEFDKQPLLKPQVEKIMKRLGQGVNVVVVDGVKASWNLAQEKNNELTRKIFGRAKTKKLSPEQLQAYFTRNEDGLAAFLERKTAGMNLSDRVWKLTESFKEEMEIAIEQGMRDGRSADQLSRDIRQYLKQPNMLFRRVRDKKTGRLRLSKRAANYHPGQGVYRSSYKNARRLAATEGNIAYRTADHERWLNSDFVVGYEIHLSNNHTCLNDQGKAVRFHCMCDDLQGKYPKQFKFTGWHPHCRCFATPILKTEEEMERDIQLILEGKNPLPQSENEVKTMPKVFETWMERNQERIANAKSLPYFIKDNFKEGKPEMGYGWNDFTLGFNDIKLNPIKTVELDFKNHENITDKEVEDVLVNLSRNNPHLFRGGLSGVEITSDESTLAFMSSGRHFDANGNYLIAKGNVLRITNRDIPIIGKDGEFFNPYKELKTALRIIKENGRLSFNQEYALETLWHELLHTSARGWVNQNNIGLFEVKAMETINEFCARVSYPILVQGLGGIAVHRKKIMQRGYGYGFSVSNFNALLKYMGVSKKKAFGYFKDRLLKNPYETIREELVSFVGEKGGFSLENANELVDNLSVRDGLTALLKK